MAALSAQGDNDEQSRSIHLAKKLPQQQAMARKSFTDRARKSAAVFEPRRYIINSLLQKYGCWRGLIRVSHGLTTEAACE